MLTANLLEGIPPELAEELFTDLLQTPGFRVERIVSAGQASPPGFWYNQDLDEWVLVLQGQARLEFAAGDSAELRPGSFLNIPAHCRHRVARTDPLVPTVWLAIHYVACGPAPRQPTIARESPMSQATPQPASDPRYLAVKVVMMPRDTNPYGTIFGGVILSYVDQAGAIGAQHELRQRGWPKRRFVTVGMKSIDFHRPVWVGDIVSFYTSVLRVGRTSVTVQVSVETERDGAMVQLTAAEVTYVAVDGPPQEQRPVPLADEA